MFEILPSAGKLSHVRVSGMLTREDYEGMIPYWEDVIARNGKIRLLFEMTPDFRGWEPGAALKDIEFDAKYIDEVERVAMVGNKTWEDLVTKVTSFFVKAEVKFFDSPELPQAEAWMSQD